MKNRDKDNKRDAYLMEIPKQIWEPREVVIKLGVLITTLKAMGTAANNAGIDSDSLIHAWELANDIKKTLEEAETFRSNITPDGIKAKETLRPELEAIFSKTDQLFAGITAILQRSYTAESEQLESWKALPGMTHTSDQSVERYELSPTGDEHQDAIAQNAVQARDNLNRRYNDLVNIVNGNTVRFGNGMLSTEIGDYDFAASIKQAVAGFLGKGSAIG